MARWSPKAIALVVLALGQSVLGQSTTAACSYTRGEVITITATSNIVAATNCAVLVDGKRTLNNGLYIENITTVDLTGIEVVTRDIEIHEHDNTTRSYGPHLNGNALRNMTGHIRFWGRSPSKKTIASVGLGLPALEFLGGFLADGPFSSVDLNLGPNVVSDYGSSIRNTHADRYNMHFVSSGDITLSGTDSLGKNAVLNSNVTSTGDHGYVFIVRNVGLTSISLPKLNRTDSFQVTNNTDLTSITSSLVSTDLFIAGENSPRSSLSLPNLRIAGLNLRGFNSVNLPLLATTASDIYSSANQHGVDARFTNNTFAGLHLPSLSHVNRSLVISSNPELFDLSLPRLKTIGSNLEIDDNKVLLNVTANVLKRVGGDVKMMGSFTNVEFFSLEEVGGNFELAGAPDMDCSWFDDRFPGKIVKGTYRCTGNHTHPAVERRPSTATHVEDVEDVGGEVQREGDTESGGLSTGAKAGIGVGAAVGGLVVLALGVWVFLKRREKKVEEAGDESGKPEMDGTGVAGLGAAGAGEKESVVTGEKDVSELPIVESQARIELSAQREVEVRELAASKLGDTTGKSELAAAGLERKDVAELP
ncbi:hypothetical protein OQA88_10920 [Cercophora sp. LCS_1]